MKTQIHRRVALALVFAVYPFVNGCDPEANGSGPSLIAAALAQPAVQTVAVTNETPAAPQPEPSEPAVEKPASPPVPAGEVSLPPSIKPSSPLAEIVKLAQSGVDAGVMLTYITNSSSTFGLGADEIVYLNDLGLPSEVITTMMEHDKGLKQFWADQVKTQQAASPPPEAAPTEQSAVAPSYENPPQAEPLPAEPQPADVTYNYFYDSLSPYGSWVNVDGYGMCWQPSVTVINRGWQPYRDCGRWIYTDCGWYWYSDYTWGWAPFHYGRWFSHPSYGWCWNPGYTWGPSWVSWRYNDGYCGWAPLPPAAHYSAGFGFTYYGSSVGVSFGFGLGYDCYTFVPWNRFCNYRPSRYCAPSHETKQIYNKSTVVNNVIIGDNNTIINRGVPVERVTAATKRGIQKVAIRDVASVSGRSARRERLERDGQTLAVHRPQPSQGAFASTSTTTSEARQGRPTETRTLQSGESPSQRLSGQSPTSRPTHKEELSPASGRAFAGERPATRSADLTSQTRNSVATRNDSGTASTRAPAPRPVDVPSTRSVAPTGNSAAENPLVGSRRPERSTVPPLVVVGSERANGTTARPTNPQASAPSRTGQSQSPSSLVVIGRRENVPLQRQGIVVMPQPQSRAAETPRPDVNATSERQSSSRPAEPQRSFSQPEAMSPSTTRNVQPQYTPRPSYSTPVQRPSAPAPSFTPRPSSPSPAPQISRPAPAPAPAPAARPQSSAPAVSAPRSSPPPAARPESSSRSSDSRPRGRN